MEVPLTEGSRLALALRSSNPTRSLARKPAFDTAGIIKNASRQSLK